MRDFLIYTNNVPKLDTSMYIKKKQVKIMDVLLILSLFSTGILM